MLYIVSHPLQKKMCQRYRVRNLMNSLHPYLGRKFLQDRVWEVRHMRFLISDFDKKNLCHCHFHFHCHCHCRYYKGVVPNLEGNNILLYNL